jgi:hypothetical protein
MAAVAWNWTVKGGPTGSRRTGTTMATCGLSAMLRALRLDRIVWMYIESSTQSKTTPAAWLFPTADVVAKMQKERRARIRAIRLACAGSAAGAVLAGGVSLVMPSIVTADVGMVYSDASVVHDRSSNSGKIWA